MGPLPRKSCKGGRLHQLRPSQAAPLKALNLEHISYIQFFHVRWVPGERESPRLLLSSNTAGLGFFVLFSCLFVHFICFTLPHGEVEQRMELEIM